MELVEFTRKRDLKCRQSQDRHGDGGRDPHRLDRCGPRRTEEEHRDLARTPPRVHPEGACHLRVCSHALETELFTTDAQVTPKGASQSESRKQRLVTTVAVFLVPSQSDHTHADHITRRATTTTSQAELFSDHMGCGVGGGTCVRRKEV